MVKQDIINRLFAYEEQLIHEFLFEITNRNPTKEIFERAELIQYNLIRKDDYNVGVLAHQFLIQKLINFVFPHFFKIENEVFKVYHFNFLPKTKIDLHWIKKLTPNAFGAILETLHTNFLNTEFVYQNDKLKNIKSKINLKEIGAVYTQNNIAEQITFQTLQNSISQGNTPNALKILDFGCGTGRFYLAALQILNEHFDIPKKEIIRNLYAIDIDKIALTILRTRVLLEVGFEYLNIVNDNIIHRNMLIGKNGLAFEENNYFDWQNDFSEVLKTGGFDVIISNPPYFLLKINKKYSKNKYYKKYYQFLTDKISKELKHFRKSGFYYYAIEGMLNYYKLSIETILKLTKPKGEIGIICPSTLFGDVSSSKLRKFILEQNQLRQLKFFGEGAKLFDNVSQATAIFYLSKGQRTKKIDITLQKKSFQVSYHLLQQTFPKNLEIPQMEEIGWDILKKLNNFKKLKAFKTIRNRRGEFDLLQFKSLILKEKTDFRLVRGNMINCKAIDYTKQKEFVKIDEFKKAKSKDFLQFDFQKKRLVCQQISNMKTAKRLKFLPCSKNDILANSCNYLTVNDLTQIKNLQILLNSYLLNWRFKATSTNNHINNYELAELPLIDFTNFSSTINGNELKNNVEIAKQYKLNKREILHVLGSFYSKNEISFYL